MFFKERIHFLGQPGQILCVHTFSQLSIWMLMPTQAMQPHRSTQWSSQPKRLNHSCAALQAREKDLSNQLYLHVRRFKNLWDETQGVESVLPVRHLSSNPTSYLCSLTAIICWAVLLAVSASTTFCFFHLAIGKRITCTSNWHVRLPRRCGLSPERVY